MKRLICSLSVLPVLSLSAAESDFHQFVLRQLNRHNTSPLPADSGQPMLPLYTDSYAGGSYGTIDASSSNVTLDDNDPDRARGTSSVRMTWDGTGVNGWFQYGVGRLVANKPRDLAAFGSARRVRFQAKADNAGRKVRVIVFRINGTTYAQLATQTFTLSTTWTDYVMNFTAIKPKDLHAVQFLLEASSGPGPATIRLDDVRLGTDGFDPLRVPQSFDALNAATGSGLSTPAGRDETIFPNRSFLYDSALSIIELVARDDVATARNVADAILACPAGDGSYANERNAGHVLLGNGTPRSPFTPRRTLGDNAWFGIALLNLHAVTGDKNYLTKAKAISDWAETNLKTTTPATALKGYRGGYDDSNALFAWRSTEHNIDHAQFNRRLAQALTATGDVTASVYTARSEHAAGFVFAMFNNVDGHFWTGTGSDDTINTSSIPLDVQLWPVLTLAQWPEHATSIDWTRPVAWARSHLTVTDAGFTGLKFSSGMSDAVWFEGNAIAALACRALGQTANADAYVALLESARQTGPHADGQGLIASSSDDAKDLSLGATYDARLAVAPSVWAVLATRGTNPFAAPSGYLWLQQGQIIQVKEDAIAGAAPITIQRDGVPVTTGDQLTFSFDVNPGTPEDYRQALVLDTNGMFRLRHLDGKVAPALADKFGTSMRLPPGLITDDGGTEFYLGVRVDTMNVITTGAAAGTFAIDMTGVPVNGNGDEAPVAVHWRLTLLPPQHKATETRLATEATANSTFHLSASHLANAEAFRAAVFSSSYVPADHTSLGMVTHDADQLRLTSASGEQLLAWDLGLAAANQLLLPGGSPFDGHLELNQIKPAPLNSDPPSMFVEMLPGGDIASYRAQGYKTVDTWVDENADNLGVWASRSFASTTIASGTTLSWSQRIVAYDSGPLLPLEAFAGSYFGVFTQPGASFADMGSMQISVAAGGTFTGKLVRGSASYPISGTFDSLGHCVRTIGPVPSPQTVTLDLDLTGGSEQITGTIFNGANTLAFAADRAVFSTTRPTPLAATYNVTFDPGMALGAPAGAGWARLTVSTAGIAAVAGNLADGTAFTNSAALSRTGTWPLHVPLYVNAGALSGRLVFAKVVGVGDATGSLAWSKPSTFTTSLAAAACKYVAPLAGKRVLTVFDTSLGAATVRLGSLTQAVTISTANVVTISPNPSTIKMTITPSLGQFSGTFVHSSSLKSTSFKGVFLPEQGRGRGYLIGPSGSELVEVIP